MSVSVVADRSEVVVYAEYDLDELFGDACIHDSVVVGVVFSRIAAEFILIVFRINEHLGAIRDQGQTH